MKADCFAATCVSDDTEALKADIEDQDWGPSFAMLGVPAEYAVTGVMIFMVSENGKIMEADLVDIL